jgi:hypothetical protein
MPPAKELMLGLLTGIFLRTLLRFYPCFWGIGCIAKLKKAKVSG